MMTRRTMLHAAAGLAGAAAMPRMALAGQGMQIAVRSPRFLANGVTTDVSGRIYLSLPRWTGMEDTPGLARVTEEGIAPFPGGAWHDAASAPGDRLLGINAVHAFDDGLIWAVDQGMEDGTGQKLLAFRPDGTLIHRLAYGDAVLPKGAMMNDLRKDGSRIYVTDSGLGGLILHDLDTGRSLRRLSEHPALRVAPDRVQRATGGLPLEDADGTRPHVHSDMIELTGDGRWLYWAMPAGPLRRIDTAALWDDLLDDKALARRIETVAEIPSIGGTAIDHLGNIYLAEAEERRIAVLTPDGRRLTLVQDDRLISPDAIWIDAKRRLMVPAAQSERLPEHAGGQDLLEPPFLVLAMDLPETLDGRPLGRAVFVPKEL